MWCLHSSSYGNSICLDMFMSRLQSHFLRRILWELIISCIEPFLWILDKCYFLHSSMLILIKSLDLIPSWCRPNEIPLHYEWSSISFSMLIIYLLYHLVCFINICRWIFFWDIFRWLLILHILQILWYLQSKETQNCRSRITQITFMANAHECDRSLQLRTFLINSHCLSQFIYEFFLRM